MKKRSKYSLFIGIMFSLMVGFGLFFGFYGELFVPKTQQFRPHYFTYEGIESKIYVISETTTFTSINQTYYSPNSVEIAKGSGLFTISLTLRNDYSSENPPPATNTPVTPIDGTAYIILKPALFDNDVTVPMINVSPSDFLTSRSEETGLVLASGQTVNLQLLLATNQTKITGFIVGLSSVSDSIPR